VHPGALLPDIDDFQEIRVDAIFSQQAPERGFMKLWGAGSHHHAVKIEVIDILSNISLARLGARIEMIPADRDSGKIPGRRDQRLRVDHSGDIVPAVADIKTDAEFIANVVHDYFGTPVAQDKGGKRKKGEKGKEKSRTSFV